VSLDSLYGMKLVSLPPPRLSSFSVRAVITFLRTCNDLFISEASLAYCPVVPVKDCFSEPAKSTNCNFETVILFGSFKSWDSIVIEKMQWDLELTSFRLCEASTRFLEPNLYRSITSFEQFASKMYKFSTTN